MGLLSSAPLGQSWTPSHRTEGVRQVTRSSQRKPDPFWVVLHSRLTVSNFQDKTWSDWWIEASPSFRDQSMWKKKHFFHSHSINTCINSNLFVLSFVLIEVSVHYVLLHTVYFVRQWEHIRLDLSLLTRRLFRDAKHQGKGDTSSGQSQAGQHQCGHTDSSPAATTTATALTTAVCGEPRNVKWRLSPEWFSFSFAIFRFSLYQFLLCIWQRTSVYYVWVLVN